jgi:ATP adenylyltransferase
VVRVATALRDKPTSHAAPTNVQRLAGRHPKPKAAPPAGSAAPSPPPPNPFLPYDEALFVRHLVRTHPRGAMSSRLRSRGAMRAAWPTQAPHHVLLLNKFNVVPHHLLLVTRAFAHQTQQLDADDMAALTAALRAFPAPGGLAFMNVGEASGFSQPHKHVQLVPLPFAAELPHAPVPIGPAVEAAAAAAADPHEPFPVRSLPFRNAACRLPRDASPAQLAALYDRVLRCALADSGGATSYNMLMTAAWLLILPRAAEHGAGVAVNALGFAGTMLVSARASGASVALALALR